MTIQADSEPILMQTFVCVPCGRGWPINISKPRRLHCTNCGKPAEPRGIPWIRIPLEANQV